jgi:hypothetical protein
MDASGCITPVVRASLDFGGICTGVLVCSKLSPSSDSLEWRSNSAWRELSPIVFNSPLAGTITYYARGSSTRIQTRLLCMWPLWLYSFAQSLGHPFMTAGCDSGSTRLIAEYISARSIAPALESIVVKAPAIASSNSLVVITKFETLQRDVLTNCQSP